MKLETEMIHTDTDGPASVASLTTPIYETTTFVFDTAEQVREYAEGKSKKFLYSRYANPTVQAVERTIAALEGAESALVLSSGQAATTTALLALLRAGDEVICSSAIYGGTLHLLSDLLPKFGIVPRFATLDELASIDRVFSSATKLVWFESPINPTLRCVDVAAIAAACRARGVISVIDNTFATPVNQRPISLGVDIVMHSATKYLIGHSDVTAGALAGPDRLIEPIEKARRSWAACSIRTPPMRSAAPEDARRPHAAPQRERDGRRPVARARQPRRAGLLSGLNRIPPTRPRAQMRALAAWCA
jgi:cystathionine gamma-synthase/methionine-gamma-lyase